MYSGGKVPTAVAAGAGGSGATAATGLPSWVWILCVVIGAFALLMASGAAWRVVPAGLRRRF